MLSSRNLRESQDEQPPPLPQNHVSQQSQTQQQVQSDVHFGPIMHPKELEAAVGAQDPAHAPPQDKREISQSL